MNTDPRDDLMVAMADFAGYRGTAAYAAFRDVLKAIEAVHVDSFGRAKPEELLAIQQRYRQVVAIRKAMESDSPGDEMPIP